jgi:hypothetical protein
MGLHTEGILIRPPATASNSDADSGRTKVPCGNSAFDMVVFCGW